MVITNIYKEIRAVGDGNTKIFKALNLSYFHEFDNLSSKGKETFHLFILFSFGPLLALCLWTIGLVFLTLILAMLQIL